MERKLLIIIFIGLIFFGISNWYILNTTRQKYLTNTTELYSLFTPYMEKYVDSYLQAIGRTSNKYYYEDSGICFIYDNFDTCFNYTSVMRSGKKKMNPKGVPSLIGNYDKNTEINFYSFGISKLLGCRCKEECICNNEIKAQLDEIDNMVVYTFPESIDIKQKIEEIAEIKGSECNFTDRSNGITSISCENFAGTIIQNKMGFVII